MTVAVLLAPFLPLHLPGLSVSGAHTPFHEVGETAGLVAV